MLAAAAALSGCASAPPIVHRADAGRLRAFNRPYTVFGQTYAPGPQPGYDEVGTASWYGYESGRRTSDGEALRPDLMSVAHRTLPIPSILEITNLQNGRRIFARLNDRGPFRAGRLIDVSRAAARELGFLGTGSARVRVRYVGPAEPRSARVRVRYVGLAEPNARKLGVADPTAASETFVTAAVVADPSPMRVMAVN